jgi:F0F1-type ATP synthase delta subunit
MENIKSLELEKEILTKEDLIFYLEELKILENLCFKEPGVSLKEKAKGKVSEKVLNLVENLEKKGELLKNPEKNKEFFEEMRKQLSLLPQIKIKIAFEPKREFLKKLSLFFEEKLHKKIILDVTVDPEIIGGVIFEWGGKIFDFSLAKKIKKFI